MAESTLEDKNAIPSATGPAGPIPHPAYCAPRCYADGKHGSSGVCRCKGCRGDAHGRGRKYAWDHGYLKNSLPGSRKLSLGPELPFPDEPLTPVEEAD